MLFTRSGPAPNNVGEPRLRRDVDFVREIVARIALAAEREVVVLDRSRHLLGEILIQRSAGGEVDELHAAAHAEHRLVVRDAPIGERELDAIALAVGLVAERMRIAPYDIGSMSAPPGRNTASSAS